MLPEAPPPPAEIPAVLISRRDCTVYGALTFTICYVLVLIGVAVNFFVKLGYVQAVNAGRPFLIMLYTGVPIDALLGTVVGFELHRLATRARKPFPLRWYVCVLAFFFVGVVAILFLLASRRRQSLIVEGKRPTYFPHVCYALLIVAAYFIPLRPSKAGELYYVSAGLSSVLGLLLADCLVVNKIALWNQQLRLALDKQKFQFSLSTLFFGSLLIGLYFTGLVLILRR
jgi:hypothetical protein